MNPNTAISAALAVLLGTHAAQSSAAADSDLAIEEVIVTAQKREQSLQDVPSAVSALSADYLEKTNTRKFSDVVKVTPGLYISDTRDGLGQAVSLRGVGVSPFTSNLRPSVTFFIDDVPLYRLDSAFNSLIDLERIEVLKGPQSTLYGKEVAAGAILMTTRKPQLDTLEGGIDIEVGSNARRELRGKINVPISDNMALRLVAYGGEVEGELTNILTGKVQETENDGARLRFLYQPSDQLNIIASYEQHNTRVRHAVRDRITYGTASQAAIDAGLITLPADPFDDLNAAATPSGRDIRTENSALHINWDINDDWSLTAITGYQEFDREMTQGGAVPGFEGTTGGDGAFLPFPVLTFRAEGSPGNERSLSQELRLSHVHGKWSALYGAFYNKLDSGEATSILVGTSFPLTTARERDNSEWSVYTHHTYDMTDRMQLVFGLRYAESKLNQRNLTSFFSGYFGDGTIPLGPKNKATFDNFGGTLKVVYALNDNVNVFGGVSQGFKPGGFNDAANSPSFDEETSVNWEAGIKGTFLDQRLRMSAHVFYQVYEDYQVQEFNPEITAGLSSILSNAAEVTVEGFEADFLWLLSEHWTLDGAIAYINARYDSYRNANCTDVQKLALTGTPAGTQALGCTSTEDGFGGAPDGFQDLSGKRLSQNSPWTGNLNLQYNATLTDNLQWYARGELAYKDDHYGFLSLEPGSYQSAYTLVNARLGVLAANGDWEVAIYGKNLTDKNYIGGFFPGRDGSLGIVGIKGEGRVLGLSAKYNF
jgi:iron complex outermembrane receptor protein